jgi:hypothetical protein
MSAVTAGSSSDPRAAVHGEQRRSHQQQRRQTMRALFRSAAAAALTVGIAVFAAGTVTLGSAVASAGSAEARALNSSQPRRVTQPRRKIPLEVLRREGVKKHLVREIKR